MPEQTPPPFREPDPAAPDSAWHDLVCAVLARRGSPRLRASAGLRAKIERELGFPTSPAVRQTRLWIAVAVAAACAVLLLRPAMQTPADHPAAPLSHSRLSSIAAAESSPAAAGVDQTTDARDPLAEPAAAITADAPRPVVSRPAATAETPASFARDAHHVVDDALAARRGGSSSALAGGGRGKARTLESVREELLPKSDYYVAGMAAAALRLPSEFNPYEQVSQPVAWTDWLAGHEQGMEMPLDEVLAISEVRAMLAADPTIAAGAPSITIMEPDAAISSEPVLSAPPVGLEDEKQTTQPSASAKFE